MQIGTVVEVNPRRGMFVVKIDDGDFVVFELLEGIDIAKNDRVSGHLNDLGGTNLRHLGQGREFSVYGQSGPSSLGPCIRMIGL